MRHVEGSIVIRAGIEDVYAYLSDLTNLPLWCSPVLDARWVEQTPGTVGSRGEVVVGVAGQPILVGRPPAVFS